MANRFTKTTRVQQEVLNLIATENIGVGDQIPTEKELARDLGTSVVTVQRALAELVQRDMIERIRGKGTFVKRALTAETLPHTLAFVLVNRSTGLYERTLEACRLAAGKRGHYVRLVGTAEHPDATAIDQLTGVSGAILSGAVTDEWAELLETMHVPAVVMGLYDLKRALPTAVYDYAVGAELLVKRLYERGFRRIGLINGAQRYLPSHKILAGYRSAMEACGLEFDERNIVWCRRGEEFEDLDEFFGATDERFEALVVEPFGPLQLYLYEHDELVGKPVLGVMSDRTLIQSPLTRIEQAKFPVALGEAAVDLLFQVTAGRVDREVVRVRPELLNVRKEGAPSA